MHHFHHRHGTLHAEDVPLTDVAARVGTPTWVYSRATLERHFRVMDEAFGQHPHTVCFAVKANPSLGVLALLGALGAGADVVSGGELFRALRAGIPADRVVYSGVGKTERELTEALRAGIRSFHVESEGELEILDALARGMGTRAPVSLRVNPDIDPATHPYISTGLRTNKFGVPLARAAALYDRMARLPGLRIHGVASHIGSQITQLGPIAEAAARLVALARALRSAGHPVTEVDFGGGLGIAYRDEVPPSPADYARAILDAVGDSGLHVVVEPGRVIAGNAGVLLGRVLYVKQAEARTFLVTDVGMNDSIRPALYGAHHGVVPVAEPAPGAAQATVDVVGPVCESADFQARDRTLPLMHPGDLFCVMGEGAYGASMSSQYNSRPRAAEVLVDGGTLHVIRTRESYEDLVRHESVATLPPPAGGRS
ncbi:MAG: diaminopimelate decarboxylase [Deltaproteobacteria bacterium]|nr:diaminopimelate decarboxylase [Deltaproteobacteria bacterium]